MNDFLQFNPILLQSSESYKTPDGLATYYADNNLKPSNPFIESYLNDSNTGENINNYEVNLGSEDLNTLQSTSATTKTKVLPTMKEIINNIVLSKIKAKADAERTTNSDGFSNGVVYDQMVTPQVSKQRAKQAIDFFQKKGLTKEQASGIVGNLEAESGLNTTAKGDGNTSFGIAQWHNQR